MRPGRLLASCVLGLVVLAACASDGDGVQGGSTPPLACKQKPGADGNKDCAEKVGTPRKLDCSSEGDTKAALAAGCVLEKTGGRDVCCPTTVSGSFGGGGASAFGDCTEPPDTLTDSDCKGTLEPRKIDCTSAGAQSAGIARGCRKETPEDATDFDLCCPLDVRAVP